MANTEENNLDHLEIADDEATFGDDYFETPEDAPLADEDVAEGEDAAIDEDDGAHWYVLHTYSGYENKVKLSLEQIVKNAHLENDILDIAIPSEERVEIHDGKRRVVRRKLYPGYVLIKIRGLEDNDRLWYTVRNVRGVTGFVGSNTTPIPLTQEEQAIMGLVSDWDPIIDYGVGDIVKVINGPLEGNVGKVQEINMEKKKVRVLVSMFGRETPVDLDFTQVLHTY